MGIGPVSVSALYIYISLNKVASEFSAGLLKCTRVSVEAIVQANPDIRHRYAGPEQVKSRLHIMLCLRSKV